MEAHDLDGYITKRVVTVDQALADGTYDEWPELLVDIPVTHLYALSVLARRRGLSVPDLIAAIVEQRAREEIRALL